MMNLFRLKKVYFFFATVFVFILHFPFAFSKSTAFDLSAAMVTKDNSTLATESNFSMRMEMLYDSLQLDEKGLSPEAFDMAVEGYEKLLSAKKIKREGVISIADFSKSSAEKRFFVLDLEQCKILFQTYVAHGRNTGGEFAKYFSNRPESFQSSLGFYLTEDTYQGKNGFSMQLSGLEPGINDKARQRAIVMHGASYANESFIRHRGYLGRSQGCPALPEKMNKPIIQKIKNGTCLFIFGKDKNYSNQSKLI